MLRIEKIESYDRNQESDKTSGIISKKSNNISFKSSNNKSTDLYGLMGLDLKLFNGNPPVRLLNNISDTVRQRITEDSKKQVEIAQGNKGAHWCAYTVSHFLRENGVKIPVMPAVSQFIDWGTKNRRYKKLSSAEINTSNYKTQIPQKEKAINTQINSMQQGDLIIWKSTYIVSKNGKLQNKQASHIGIVTKIDKKSGKITVAEGNANISQTTTVNGIRGVKTGKKTLPKDMLMEKTYNAHDLTMSGYSGYINMDGLCK